MCTTPLIPLILATRLARLAATFPTLPSARLAGLAATLPTTGPFLVRRWRA